MERILNKIDDSLRKKVKEITKEGKIHSVKENKITDDNEYKRENKNALKEPKKTYYVKAQKNQKYEVEAFEAEDKNNTIGRFLDEKE